MAAPSLEFERPINDLERQIDELRRVAGDRDLDVAAELAPLEKELNDLRVSIYRGLSPLQRVQVARIPKRPFTLDYIRLAFTDFSDLSGHDSHSFATALRTPRTSCRLTRTWCVLIACFISICVSKSKGSYAICTACPIALKAGYTGARLT